MANSFENLRELQNYLQSLVQNGTFTLTATDLPSLTALFNQWLGGGPLVIDNAQVSLDQRNNVVVVSGKGNSLAFYKTNIAAAFGLPSPTEVTIAVDAKAIVESSKPLSWTLATAFPALNGTLYALVPFTQDILRETRVTLRSVASGAAPAGLALDGLAELSVGLAPLAPLFPNELALPFAGPFDSVVDQAPAFRWSSTSATRVTIDPFVFRMTLVLLCNKTVRQAEIVTSLEFAETQSLTITGSYDGLQPTLGLRGDVAELAKLAFSILRQLAGGENLLSVMPTQFPIVDKFSVTSWSAQISTATGSASLVTFILQVGTLQPWEIVPSLLVLQSLTFTFQLTPASKPALTASVTARLFINPDAVAEKDKGLVQLAAIFPTFAFAGQLVPGYVVPLRAMIARWVSSGAAEALPFTEVDQLSFLIDPSSAAYSFSAHVVADWTPVEPFTLTGLGVALQQLTGTTIARISGTFALDESGSATMSATAEYRSDTGWLFTGTAQNIVLKLDELIAKFFPPFAGFNPGKIVINKISTSFGSVKYAFFIDALWTLEQFPGQPSIRAIVDLTKTTEYAGSVEGIFSFYGVLFSVKTIFGSATTPATYIVKFHNITGTYQDPKITVTLSGTLGAMIEELVMAATGGQRFSLEPPWNILNSVRLDNFEFVADLVANTVGFTYKLNLDLGFARIGKIGVTYNTQPKPGERRVEFAILEGYFLGQPLPKWDVVQPAQTPKVPGFGENIVRVDFLAAGQRVQTNTPLPTNTVLAAEMALEKAFRRTAPPGGSSISGTDLHFDANVDWLLGFNLTVLQSFAIRAVFIDPELYGVSINVAGPKAGSFQGLSFEILYKRINENVGVYQLELRLPDAMRNLDFGQVTITLPIIGIQIYTNGDFLIDFGFPRNEDFSRGFGVQVLPFIGSGGFYFGVLSAQTASNVPATTNGNFSPVIALGLGLRIGIGKEINKGILAAGLSVTLQGIVEGLYAPYNPNEGQSNAFYYWIQGKVAIVGKIYGEINFAIISARLDITVRIGVTMTLQPYLPVRVGFFASVEVRLRVKIDLGIFDITINLSFKASIREEFTIGKPSKAPWDSKALASALRLGRSLTAPRAEPLPELDWAPLAPASPVAAEILYVTQLTSASEPAKAQAAAMFYVDSPNFVAVAEGTLLWALAALLKPSPRDTATLLPSTITLVQLKDLFDALSAPDVLEPFTYEQVRDFAAGYFKLTIRPVADDEPAKEVGFFPVPPPMTLHPPDGAEPIDFSTHNEVTDAELENIKKYFRAMQVAYENSAERPPNVASEPEEPQSMAKFVFTDYFVLLAKQAVQSAIDILEASAAESDGERTLASYGDSAVIARYNRTRRVRAGATLAIPPYVRRVSRGTLLSAGTRLEAPLPGRRPYDEYRIDGVQHVAAEGETLIGIARRYGVDVDDLARANAEVFGLFAKGERIALDAIDSLTVAELVAKMNEKDPQTQQSAFEAISGYAARVMLQGLRPPFGAEETPTALYEAIGQQFDASTLGVGGTFSLTLPDLPWLRFAGDPQKLEVLISAELAQIIQSFNGAVLDPPFQPPQVQPFYRTEYKRFTLGNGVEWRSAVDTPAVSLWDFPANLLTILRGPCALQPKVKVQEEPADVVEPKPEPLPPSDYTWAATFDVTVRQVISQADPATVIPFTYDVLGTGAEGGIVLENILRYANEHGESFLGQISVLWPSDPTDTSVKALVGAPPEEVTFFLLQTNLSTVSNPNAAVAVAEVQGAVPPLGQSALDFLRFLWEGSVVRSGGYSLYYKHTSAEGTEGLPSFLFEDGENVVVTIVVKFTISDDILRDFMSALVVTKPVEPARTVFYLQSVPQTVNVVLDAPLGRIAKRHGLTLYEFVERNRDVPLAAGAALRIEGELLASCEDGDTFAGLAARNGISVARLANQNRDTLLAPAAPLVADEALLDRVVTIPPGNAGFDLTRTAPQAPQFARGTQLAEETSAQGLEELYNLLGYRIEGSGGFTESPYGLPLTPATDDDTPTIDAVWRYQAVLPVARYGPVPPPETNAPDPLLNPYRGVGSTATFGFVWQDLFGNRMATQPSSKYALPVAFRYYDPLVGVDSWPGVATEYSVRDAGAGAMVYVDLAFDSSRYKPVDAEDESYVERARADRDQWALVYYQLSQDAAAYITATLDPGVKGTSVAAALKAYALEVWQYLDALVRTGVYEPKTISTELSRAVSDTSGLADFQLQVAIAIERTANVEETMLDPLLDPVRTVSALAKPRYTKQGTGDDAPLTLTQFATDLQAAFPELKVATALPQVEVDDEAATREVWLLRFAPSGYQFSFGAAPLFFAIPPLATTPLSIDSVAIYPYSSTKPIYEETPVLQSRSGVDLDTLARTFLGAIDTFLLPDFVVPGWIAIDDAGTTPNPIDDVLASKRLLAEAIAGKLTTVYADQSASDPARAAAVEMLKQQLLITLGTAATVDSVVQFAATITSPDSGTDAPQVFGKPVVEDETADQRQNFSFSTGRVPLDKTPGQSFLTFLFTARQKEEASVVELPLAFRVSNFQHDIHAVPGIEGYKASTWLAFVIPFAGSDLGEVPIPLPLRAYPTPPAMAAQSGTSEATPESTLDETRLWTYRYTYAYAAADQDRIHTSVQYNVVQNPPLTALADEPNLLEALLQFSSVWPQISADLNTALLGGGDPAIGINAMLSLAWLAGRAARAWGRWSPPVAFFTSDASPEWIIDERGIEVGGEMLLLVTISGASGTLPRVDIAGYEAHPHGTTPDSASYTYTSLSDGTPLTEQGGRRILERTLVIAHRDVLLQQNAWAAASVGRNEVFSYGDVERDANQAFVYRTPDVRFVDVFTPLLQPDILIDIGKLVPAPPPPDKLLGYLQGFFARFLSPVQPGEDRTIKMAGGFVYDLSETPGVIRFPVELPVFLATPVPIAPSGSPFLINLSAFILDWFERNGLTGRDGELRFEVSVFSTLTQSELPLLKLTNVRLATNLIWSEVRDGSLV